MMDISRNQFYFAGLLCLLLGTQFRLIDSVELTPEFTQFLAERTGHPLAAVGAATQALSPAEKPMVKKAIHPPEPLGWALLSVGAVLVLHSWGMKKAG